MGLIPTKSYEDLLGDGLESLIGKGVDDLAGFAEGLNESNVRGPAGEQWTVELLERELKRLGDPSY
jgi:hypothetical protein